MSSSFITHIEREKHEPYTVIFTTDDHDKYRHIEDECRKMIGHAKPMTNADKCIRNATDEELARFIAKAQADILRTVGRALKYQGDLVRDCDLEDAADDWLIWLKQEAVIDAKPV